MNELSLGSDATLDATAVAAYLERHPGFLLEHPALLSAIELEHEVQGATSLVKRQVTQLRESNQTLRTRLNALIANARANEQLMTSLLDLTFAMARAVDLDDQLVLLGEALRDTFKADDMRLLLHGTRHDPALPDWVSVVAELPEWRSELAGQAVSCGGEENRTWARELGTSLEGDTSWAIALLGEPDDPTRTSGVLALGSRDATRFVPGMSTDFLVLLGRMVGGLLRPLPEPAAEA